MTFLRTQLTKPAVVAFLSVLSLALITSAGSLTPPGAPTIGTMVRLSTIWGVIASDSYDSSIIDADQNGSLFENLKYIESQLT